MNPDIDLPFNDTLASDRSGKEFVSESSTAGKTVYRMNFMASEILKNLIFVKNTDLIEVKLNTELVLLALIAEIIANKDDIFFRSKRNQKKI